MKVLIVDDDMTTVQLMKAFLENRSYEVSTAFDGKQGLIEASDHAYELIFLDLSMPELSGLEVIKELKSKNTTAKIIMMTAYPSSIEPLARAAGVDAYISKPFDWDEISEILKKLFPSE